MANELVDRLLAAGHAMLEDGVGKKTGSTTSVYGGLGKFSCRIPARKSGREGRIEALKLSTDAQFRVTQELDDGEGNVVNAGDNFHVTGASAAKQLADLWKDRKPVNRIKGKDAVEAVSANGSK